MQQKKMFNPPRYYKPWLRKLFDSIPCRAGRIMFCIIFTLIAIPTCIIEGTLTTIRLFFREVPYIFGEIKILFLSAWYWKKQNNE